MAEVQIRFDDGHQETHDVPDMGAREIDATLKLWKEFSGGIVLTYENGEEETILPPSALQEFADEDVADEDEAESQSGLHEPHTI